MKKSELKFLIKEVIKENRFSRYNPEGGKEFGEDVPGAWENPEEAEKLKDKLLVAVDAGNFDVAHKLLDNIAQFHN